MSGFSVIVVYFYYLAGYPPNTVDRTSAAQESVYAQLSAFMGEERTKICIFMDGVGEVVNVTGARMSSPRVVRLFHNYREFCNFFL